MPCYLVRWKQRQRSKINGEWRYTFGGTSTGWDHKAAERLKREKEKNPNTVWVKIETIQ